MRGSPIPARVWSRPTCFFTKTCLHFFGEDGESPLAADQPIMSRTDTCFQTLRNALMVVVIDLQKDDDPQVIFEILNARGEPLLPADLLRNYIFFRASRENLDVEAIYQKYWSGFDNGFWREEVSQGRLYRLRSDLFMQHFLASRQGQDIPIKHLYVEYRHWLEDSKPRPFANVTAELATLSRQGNDFRRIIAPEADDVLYRLSKLLDAYDIRTVYPLLLAMLDAEIGDAEWDKVSCHLESYFLRRAVCNLTTKNYNPIFLTLTKSLRKDGFTAGRLRELLIAQSSDSGIWPDNATFGEAWINKPLYGTLNSPKLIYLYTRLNQTYMSSKSETVTFTSIPSIEHIMPRGWVDNWPLPDGAKGMAFDDFISAPTDDPRASATQKRENAIQTLGNLTMLSTALNSAQSNNS
jgi:hypothetical protein